MKGWYLVSGDVTKDYVEPHVVTNYVSDGQLRSFETTCSVRQFRAWRSAAALLTLLANEKDINADGEVVDRSGRRGIGFSVLSDGGGLPTKRTLIFDPATGSVLGQEQMLTETAGKMNVLIPR